MTKFIDLSGNIYGRLTIIKRANNYVSPSGNKSAMWVCRCSCGKVVVVRATDLKQKKVFSCGCYKNEQTSKRRRIHGLGRTRICVMWRDMIRRCTNPKVRSYKNYGSRGITVCDEWKNNFLSFYNWAMKNGYDDSLTIDRINTNKGYSPENCRFVSIREQENNKRTNHYVEYSGEKKSIADWSRELKISYVVLLSRINRGWETERAFFEPVIQRKK